MNYRRSSCIHLFIQVLRGAIVLYHSSHSSKSCHPSTCSSNNGRFTYRSFIFIYFMAASSLYSWNPFGGRFSESHFNPKYIRTKSSFLMIDLKLFQSSRICSLIVCVTSLLGLRTHHQSMDFPQGCICK